jgi:acyl-CoA thioester hydrolase
MNDNNTKFGKHNSTSIKQRVLFADTDKMGIVYHANYFRWFEALRGAYLRKRDRPYTVTEKEGIQLPLVECGMRYFKPASYEDLIEVKGWITEITSVQIRFEYDIFREKDLLVHGFTRHAAINTKGNPTRIPKVLMDALCSVEIIEEII